MSSSTEHDNLFEKVILALNEIPRQVVDPIGQIRIFGWLIIQNETIQKDESQSMIDVITIKAGCGG